MVAVESNMVLYLLPSGEQGRIVWTTREKKTFLFRDKEATQRRQCDQQ